MLGKNLKNVNFNISQPEELDVSVNHLNSIIVDCYKSSCPEKVLRTNTNNKWWNQDLERMRRNLRKEQRKAKRSQNFAEYHTLLTEYGKSIVKAKRDSFRKTISEEMNNISATARMQKLLSKDHTNNLESLQKPDGSFTNSEIETLSVLAENHFPGSSEDATAYPHINNDAIDYSRSIPLFSSQAVRWAIKSFKPY